MEVETPNEDTSNLEVTEDAQTGNSRRTENEWKAIYKLRDENAKARIKAAELQVKLDAQEKEFAARLADRESELKEQARTEVRRETALARIEAMALKEGIIDADLVKPENLGEFIFDEHGRVTNAKELLDAFRSAKPHFFGSVATSSTAKDPKPSKEASKIDATQMSDEEYAALKRSMKIKV